MRKVLIIDDESDIVEILANWIHDFGYKSYTVNNVDTAIKFLNETDYYAVFCDLKMPGKTGVDLFYHILETFPGLISRFVLVTGTIIDEALESTINDSGAYILKKPFVLKELEQIVTSFSSD